MMSITVQLKSLCNPMMKGAGYRKRPPETVVGWKSDAFPSLQVVQEGMFVFGYERAETAVTGGSPQVQMLLTCVARCLDLYTVSIAKYNCSGIMPHTAYSTLNSASMWAQAAPCLLHLALAANHPRLLHEIPLGPSLLPVVHRSPMQSCMKSAEKHLQEKPISSRNCIEKSWEHFYCHDCKELLLMTSKYGGKLQLMASH